MKTAWFSCRLTPAADRDVRDDIMSYSALLVLGVTVVMATLSSDVIIPITATDSHAATDW